MQLSKRSVVRLVAAVVVAVLAIAIHAPSVRAQTVVESRVELRAATPQENLLLWAETGGVRQITALLAAGVDINTRDRDRMTPLMRAASTQQSEAIRLLLAKGADAGARDTNGHTAYWHAMQITLTGRVPFLGYGFDLHLPRLIRSESAGLLAAAITKH